MTCWDNKFTSFLEIIPSMVFSLHLIRKWKSADRDRITTKTAYLWRLELDSLLSMLDSLLSMWDSLLSIHRQLILIMLDRLASPNMWRGYDLVMSMKKLSLASPNFWRGCDLFCLLLHVLFEPRQVWRWFTLNIQIIGIRNSTDFSGILDQNIKSSDYFRHRRFFVLIYWPQNADEPWKSQSLTLESLYITWTKKNPPRFLTTIHPLACIEILQ